jgi:O-methyltransferase involved in polyketide biosynthesis
MEEKINLSPEMETLLITLLAKSQINHPIFFDPQTKMILDRLDYDFQALRVPNKTIVLVCQRAKKIDHEIAQFLKEHPTGLILHLGCGLDTRFQRLDNGQLHWVNLDLPPVIDLRRKLMPAHPRCQLIPSSVTDLSWTDRVIFHDRPVMVAVEGLLMYLQENEVVLLFQKLKTVFDNPQLIGDVFSTLTARSASRHPSLKATGAVTGWGLDDPKDVENWAPGIQLKEEWFFTQDPELSKLTPVLRWGYQAAGLFQIVRRAHRVVHYQL